MAKLKAAAERTRGRHFPYHPTLEELLRTFDPAIGPFRVNMFRRNARDLRKWLYGPDAIGDAPRGSGLGIIALPRGWELVLVYEEPPGPREAGKVIALFRPPAEEEGSQEAPPCAEAEPAIDAERTPPTQTSAVVAAQLGRQAALNRP
jgi:hypothetical protein